MRKKETYADPKEVAAIEKLIVDTQFGIHRLMEDRGISRADLAKKLGCSKSRVTQLFGDNPNLTLETLARIFHALGDECRVTSDRLEAVLHELKRHVGAQNERSWVISDCGIGGKGRLRTLFASYFEGGAGRAHSHRLSVAVETTHKETFVSPKKQGAGYSALHEVVLEGATSVH